MYSVIRARIAAGISRAMKMRMSHQLAANHVHGLLRGPLPDTLAVAKEFSFHDFSMIAVSQRDVDQAHGLLLRASARPGDTGNAYAQSGFATVANALGQRRSHFLTNRAVLFDQQRRHTRQRCLQVVVIDYSATEKIP